MEDVKKSLTPGLHGMNVNHREYADILLLPVAKTIVRLKQNGRYRTAAVPKNFCCNLCSTLVGTSNGLQDVSSKGCQT